MKDYELTVLIHPDLEMNVDPALDKVKKIIEQNGGKITKEEYNAKQKRADRRIDGAKGYMEQIRNSKNGEKLFY